MFARLLKRPAVLRAAAWCVGAYLELVLRSTRWTVEAHALTPYLSHGGVIIACWHERLPLLPAFWLPARATHPKRPIAALASRHRDGLFIAEVMRRFGVRAVHGSTARLRPGESAPRDRGGAAGLRALLAALSDGAAILITPDGPRGPRRVAAPGVGALAALAQAPVLPVAAQMRHRIVLRSWDRMVLPLPFGRGALVCLPPIAVPRDGAHTGLIEIGAALTKAAERADVLCR